MAQAKRKEKPVDAEPEAANDATNGAGSEAPVVPWVRPAPLSRRGWLVIAAVVLVINFPLIHYFLFRATPAATQSLPFHDDYSDPATVANNYWTSGGFWRVVRQNDKSELLSPGVKNNPLWLKAKLPQDAVVEFDVRSESPEGDIKCEIFGDGSDHASGYVLIHGGWNNSISVLARLDEHGESLFNLKRRAAEILGQQRQQPVDPNTVSMQQLVELGLFGPSTHMRVEANPYPVQPGRMYHWRIERRGSLIRWFIDGAEFMEFDDPFPLAGEKHNRFGFSSWEAQLYFDNLSIQAL